MPWRMEVNANKLLHARRAEMEMYGEVRSLYWVQVTTNIIGDKVAQRLNVVSH